MTKGSVEKEHSELDREWTTWHIFKAACQVVYFQVWNDSNGREGREAGTQLEQGLNKELHRFVIYTFDQV